MIINGSEHTNRLLTWRTPETGTLDARFQNASSGGGDLMRQAASRDSADISEEARALAESTSLSSKDKENPFMGACMDVSGASAGASGNTDGETDAADIADLKKRIEDLKRQIREATEVLQEARAAEAEAKSRAQTGQGPEASEPSQTPSLAPADQSARKPDGHDNGAASEEAGADTPSAVVAQMTVMNLQLQLMELNKELAGAQGGAPGYPTMGPGSAYSGGTRAKGGVGAVKGHIGTA